MAGSLDLFERSFARLAKLCDFKLDPDIIALYEGVLAPHGYDNVCRALDELALEASRGQFPSVRQVVRQITGEVALRPAAADDEAARLAAAAIVSGVARFGSINGTGASAVERTAKIQAHVGELGWELVTLRAGWNSICAELTDENKSVVEAQLRELGKAKLSRRRQGLGDAMPGLDPAGPRSVDLRAVSAVDVAGALPPGLRHLAGVKP